MRVAAVFRILPGDRLQPAFVGVPAFVAIWLEVSSGDGRSHQLVLETPARHDFEVSVGQPAKVLIPGLRAGNYRLLVDGVARGMLITGQAPGP